MKAYRNTTEIWILAIADRGLIAHVHAFENQDTAWTHLAAYLRRNEHYSGDDSSEAVRRWLDQHDERLSVTVTCQKGLGGHDVSSKHSSLDQVFSQPGFVVLTGNEKEPSKEGDREAWAYRGYLDFQTAMPVTFGVGTDCHDALEALDGQLSRHSNDPANPDSR